VAWFGVNNMLQGKTMLSRSVARFGVKGMLKTRRR